jgi:hypothetical protein
LDLQQKEIASIIPADDLIAAGGPIGTTRPGTDESSSLVASFAIHPQITVPSHADHHPRGLHAQCLHHTAILPGQSPQHAVHVSQPTGAGVGETLTVKEKSNDQPLRNYHQE